MSTPNNRPTDAMPRTGLHRAPPTRPPLAAATLGIIGAVVVLFAGGWLMLAPFALGYQPEGAEWADATVVDFWSGLGLAVLAFVVGLVLVGDLVGRLRAAGAIAARPAADVGPPAGAVPGAPTPNDELVALIRPLVQALSRDADDRAAPPAPPSTAPSTTPANHTNAGPTSSLER